MKYFLITLFLGEFGIHRFMKRKYITGAIWLCTFGLFGIGWLVDTIVAFMNIKTEKQSIEQHSNTFSGGEGVQTSNKQFIKSFDTVIVGTFAKSSKYPDEKREDQIFRIKKNAKLDLEFWRYKGDPAYYVCDCGTDVGCIRAGLAKIIYDEYSDCEFVVTALERVMDDRNECMTYKIRIDIYR